MIHTLGIQCGYIIVLGHGLIKTKPVVFNRESEIA